jgi:serine/threonine protein kinase
VTPERWKEIEAVFERVRELSENERPLFLTKTCEGDEDLRREVESLLASHAQAGDFIDRRSLFFSAETFEETGAILQTGELIGPYRVLREIGRGGMGAVYLAERADDQYQKRVAIKLIKRGMDTDSVLRHFRNERQILASFDHPNIAHLFDGGTSGEGLPYFVMEYVEGVPIDRYSDSNGLAIVERLKLFREVCAAVSYAHRHAVIHRDIKPSNILVTSEGAPKLLDFGIAKILGPGGGSDPLMTATGARPMTPEYASPEQISGQPVTTASDVYSLGVVLYELLAGRLPYRFASHSPVDVSRAITEQNPERPSTAVAKRTGNSKAQIPNPKLLRGDLDNIVLMALRKEPARRYQSVEQLSDDIRRYLEARPIIARKDSVVYRAAKFVRRNRVATAAAALVLLSLIAGLAATTWQAQRAKSEKARAERRFNDVRQLAHSVLFDYHDAIKDLPGATRVRERLVKDALVYLDNLAGEAAGDLDLQRELAAAYERVGDVRGQAYSASLGDRAGAIDSYSKALHIRETLVAAAPRDVQNRRDLAASYKKMGNQLLDTSEAARGLEYLNKSLALCSDLVAEQPADLKIHHELAEMHDAIGSAQEGRGEIPGALEHYRKALPIYEDLLAVSPKDRTNRRSLSVTLANIGRALFLNNDTKGALESSQKALALREALLAEDPTNAEYRRSLGISYQDNGDYQAWLKNTREALDSFRKKLALDEQAVAADSSNVQAPGDMAYSCHRLGDLLTELGDHSQALSYYRRALELYEKGVAADPQDLVVALRAIMARTRVGKTHAKLGNIDSADNECRIAADLLQTTIDDAANISQRRLRVLAYGDLGETYAMLAADPRTSSLLMNEHWRGARNMYQHSLNLMQDLRDRGILDAEEIPEIEKTSRKIADCDAALEKKP